MLLGQVCTLKCCFVLSLSINLVAEEISQNKSVVQTPVTYFINQKEKDVSIRHNSMLTLMKSGAHHFPELI